MGPFRRRVAIRAATPSSAEAVSSETETVCSLAPPNESDRRRQREQTVDACRYMRRLGSRDER